MTMLNGMPGLLVFMWSAVVALSSCNRRTATVNGTATETRQAKIDACALLSKQEVEVVQQSPITETKSSEQGSGDFQMSQCFYTAAEFNKSVNLALMQKRPTDAHKRTPKEFWRETFERAGEKGEKGETEREENERRTPPKKIEAVGDDAYWVPNRFGGVLYVLKGDAFISISVGGTDNEQTKIDKCKNLAQKVIGRM